jgi:hypothetical protein
MRFASGKRIKTKSRHRSAVDLGLSAADVSNVSSRGTTEQAQIRLG